MVVKSQLKLSQVCAQVAKKVHGILACISNSAGAGPGKRSSPCTGGSCAGGSSAWAGRKVGTVRARGMMSTASPCHAPSIHLSLDQSPAPVPAFQVPLAEPSCGDASQTPCTIKGAPPTAPDQEGLGANQHSQGQPSAWLQPLAVMKRKPRRRGARCPAAALPEEKAEPSCEPPPCKRQRDDPGEEGECTAPRWDPARGDCGRKHHRKVVGSLAHPAPSITLGPCHSAGGDAAVPLQCAGSASGQIATPRSWGSFAVRMGSASMRTAW